MSTRQLYRVVTPEEINAVPISHKGAPGGVATLDQGTEVEQLPADRGDPSTVATLDANSRVVQLPAAAGQPLGLATLNAGGNVVQPSDANLTVVRKSVATGVVAAGATVNVAVPWDAAFPADDYTVIAEVEDADNDLRVVRIVSKTAAQVVVRVVNDDAINAANGTVHALASTMAGAATFNVNEELAALETRLDQIHVNVKDHGATGDGVTDDTDAIEVALAAIPAGTGGIVFFPIGTYVITRQIVVPQRIRLAGVTALASVILADATFPINTAMIVLGNINPWTHGATIEYLQIDCAGVAGSIGVYSQNINEMSGIFCCWIRGWRDRGVWIQDTANGTPQNFAARDSWVTAHINSAATARAIDLDLAGPLKVTLDYITVAGHPDAAALPLEAGILCRGVQGTISNIHFEKALAGLQSGAGGRAGGLFTASALDGLATVIDLVRIDGDAAQRDQIYNGLVRAGSTNAINDLATGGAGAIPRDVTQYIRDSASTGFFTTDIVGSRARRTLGPWVRDDVPAGIAVAQELAIAGDPSRTHRMGFRGGSVTGIIVRSNAARTAGSLTVEVTIGGVPTGLRAVIDGANATAKATTQLAGLDTFVATARIGVIITTTADWAPALADITAEVEVVE